MNQNRQITKTIKIRNKLFLNWMWQILLICLPILSFLSAASVNKCIKGQFLDFRAIIIAVFSLDAGYVVCWLVWAFLDSKYTLSRRKKHYSGKWEWLAFVLLYSIIIRMVQLGDIQRWDASIYYNAIRNGCAAFDFTLLGFLENFSVASHMTWGYMGILGIGEFLYEGSTVSVQVVNLLLILICVYCLYCIMEKLLQGKEQKFIALSVCILSSLPVFAGTFSYCNPDMGVAIFSVFMIYCYMRKHWALVLFCMILTVTSKETGILFVGGFTTGIFLWRFKEGKGNIVQRGMYAMKDYLCREAVCVCVCVFIIAAIYLLGGGKIWSMQSASKSEFSTFTFIPSFIWNNIKQFLGLNFNWIPTILIGVCLGKAIWNRMSGGTVNRFNRPELIAGIFGGYLASVLFYFFYITFTLPRYHIIIDLVWNILMLCCVSRYMERINLRNALLGGYCILLVFQAYTTVDPVSIGTFMNHSTGSEIILTTQHPREDLLTISSGDYNVYNHQYNYISEAVEQILREVNYDEEMDLVSFDSQEMVMDGIRWDTLNNKFTYKTGILTMPINVVKGNDIYLVESGRKAVYIYYPQNSGNLEENMEHLRWYYELYYCGEVEIQYGGTLYYWVGERY